MCHKTILVEICQKILYIYRVVVISRRYLLLNKGSIVTIKYMKYVKSVSAITVIMSLVVFFSVTKVHAAEYPNILVDQNLTVGQTNQNVVVLQGLLSELGYLKVPAGIPFGYYGSLTKDAVARYQASMNVTPAVGYFGPLTKIAMHGDFTSRGYLRILGW